MFCSECGHQATGKFCSNCGQALLQTTSNAAASPAIELGILPATTDWTTLTNYEALLHIPTVRERIARHAALSKKKLTGEEFLEACDKFLTPLTGGVPFTLIANLTQPLSTRLGLKTGKTRCERLGRPTGTVIVAALCSLAQNGHELGEVTQLENGVTLRAAAPSDLWSLKGEIHLDIRSVGSVTQIEAAFTVPGQIYDWGKSQRGLTQLFTDLATLIREPLAA
jgi:hypothetical protein